MFSLIIQNATVIDGTGAAPYQANVAIQDGKIAKITPKTLSADRIIDAAGLVLCPGFIDAHSHGDLNIHRQPAATDALAQGITFCIGGQCGGSVAPSDLQGRFATMDAYVQQMAQQPTANHMGLLIGHGSIRAGVMGRVKRPPTDRELARMAQVLEHCLEKGAMGMSLGLYYAPGSYAEKRELVTLARVVSKHGATLAAHIRNEAEGLLASVEEFIGLCRESGCRGVISHLKAMEKPNHHMLPQAIQMLEKANREGLSIYADAYPYTASSTSLMARFVPDPFVPEGVAASAALLDDPRLRERIRAWGTNRWGKDLSFVTVTSCTGHPEFAGKNLNQLAEEMGFDDPFDCVFSILRERNQRCQCSFATMSEENVATVLAHPLVMIGTDSDPGSPVSMFHPRRVGAFPRVLGRYVREKGITTLPEMIRKMTHLPAQVYGISGKGRVAEGYDADLCLFDPETIRDQADYVNCTAPNVGLHYVLIAGKPVVENGICNGTQAGRIWLRK